MKIALFGASGRMGLSVARLAESEEARIVGAVVSAQSSMLGRDIGEASGAGHAGVDISVDGAAALLGADVAIDFSTPAGLRALLKHAMRAKVAVVSGTTRLDETCERLLDEASRVVPVLWAPNTSVGVHVLAELAAEATRRLGPGFDIEIVETHHRAKVDAPSGTATFLANAIRAVRQGLASVSGREGNVGARKQDEIGIMALRGGDVIGEHTIHFLGSGERIELTHRATNRDLFARGALRAARFLIGRPPGRYAMADVIR